MEASKKDKRYFTVTIPKIDPNTIPKAVNPVKALDALEYEIPPMPEGFYEDVIKYFRREWENAPEFKPRRTKPMKVSVEVLD